MISNGVMMGAHTSMKVGGPAEAFFEPESEAALIECVKMLAGAGKPFFLLGNGTNVIVRDGGYPGAVISTLKALRYRGTAGVGGTRRAVARSTVVGGVYRRYRQSCRNTGAACMRGGGVFGARVQVCRGAWADRPGGAFGDSGDGRRSGLYERGGV